MDYRINSLDDVTPEKRRFIEQNFMQAYDRFVGLFHNEYEAHKAGERIQKKLQASPEWKQGGKVDGRTIERVAVRVEGFDDSFNRGIDETSMSYEERVNAAAPYIFYLCWVIRRFENPMNNLPPMIDDGESGWVPVDSVRVKDDDTRDQE